MADQPKNKNDVFLVTGALGCIGAWTVYHLLRQGRQVVSFDIAEQGHRLNLLMTPEEQQAITFVRGDLADSAQVLETFQQYGVTHVIHLAALQVPFVRANPIKGAQVNVVGTVNVFEAARQTGVKHLAYASSIAVFGPAEDYPDNQPVANDAQPSPRTLYGVFKQANEGTARIYWQDNQVSGTALRPYTVYGLGRDQGLTSDPTKAMLAAAAGKNFHINFSGAMQFQWVSDVALQFIEAAITPSNGADAYTLDAPPTPVAEVVEIIQTLRPNVKISMAETILPFPESFDGSALRQHFQNVYDTPLEEGIRQTIEGFERALADGRITAE
jgi:nucleoside-diphosphate-sugar epimerase